MIGSVDPSPDRARCVCEARCLLGTAALLLVHLKEDARHRLGVSTDVIDVLIGHRFRVLAEQFPAAAIEIGSGVGSACSTYSMGTPANSMQTFVMRWSALEARRPEVGAPKR